MDAKHLLLLTALWAVPAASASQDAQAGVAAPLPRFDAATGRYVADVDGHTATTTLDPALQQNLQSIIDRGMPQWGAIVVVDIKSGRLLGLAEHSEREPGRPGAAFRPIAKAASVFKVVTMSALLRAGVDVEQEVCYAGGKTRMRARDLSDNFRRRGQRCLRAEDALPLSQNVAVAKLAGRHLTPELLAAEAERFGVLVPDGMSGPEPTPTLAGLELPPSLAIIPEGDLFGFVAASAGFGEVRLSALDAARMAAIVGNDGVDVPFRLFDEGPVATPTRVLEEDQARMLQGMLSATVSRGTAARAFHAHPVPRALRGVPWDVDTPVAGKTGSLTDRDVSLDTSWFIGTAPAHDPQIAFAVVIVNDEWIWHVRALEVARAALATWVAAHPDVETAPVARR